MTEAAHQISSNPLPPARRRPGSIGLGQGVEVKILDERGREVPFGTEGEICIRGLNVTDNVVPQHPWVAITDSFAMADQKYGQYIGIAAVLKDQESLSQCEL